MRAFVLGGGGNLGAMQVGALRALIEDGIRPDFLLGCSVGALNAAILAHSYSMDSIEQLVHLWKNVRVHDVFPGSKLSYAWRFLTQRDGLCSSQGLHSFLIRNGISPEKTFDDIADVPLYVTATNLTTGGLDIFGCSGREHVLDALMATSAQPPLLPPWDVQGTQYVDGGTVTPLPLRSALALGATEIYSLRVEHGVAKEPLIRAQKPIRGMADVVRQSVNMMIQQQAEYDLYLARSRSSVLLHEIELSSAIASRTDFSQSTALYEQGYEIMRSHLDRAFVRLPHHQLASHYSAPRAYTSQGGLAQSVDAATAYSGTLNREPLLMDRASAASTDLSERSQRSERSDRAERSENLRIQLVLPPAELYPAAD